MKKYLLGSMAILLAYLLCWPVSVTPQHWQAPQSTGFVGVFMPNKKLAGLELLTIADQEGPEGVAIDQQGSLYVSTHSGWIVRLDPQGHKPELWVNTHGRPLGMAFNPQGDLIVADAFLGLLSISPNKQVQLLTKQVDGTAILYANSVDISQDGRIFFSDASTKFSAKANGGTYPASLLDILEHGGHGRLLLFNPANQTTTVLMNGLNFSNGVALDSQEQFVLLNETGHYRIHKYWLNGVKKGQSEILIDNLPGFPDNLSRGQEGRFWLGLASPRNPLLDNMADKPWLRKIVQRLPSFVRPQAVAYGHVIAISAQGEVLQSLQDPSGAYPVTTGVAETDKYLYISSLMADRLGRLGKLQPISSKL